MTGRCGWEGGLADAARRVRSDRAGISGEPGRVGAEVGWGVGEIIRVRRAGQTLMQSDMSLARKCVTCTGVAWMTALSACVSHMDHDLLIPQLVAGDTVCLLAHWPDRVRDSLEVGETPDTLVLMGGGDPKVSGWETDVFTRGSALAFPFDSIAEFASWKWSVGEDTLAIAMIGLFLNMHILVAHPESRTSAEWIRIEHLGHTRRGRMQLEQHPCSH